jgi:hypothetical protein
VSNPRLQVPNPNEIPTPKNQTPEIQTPEIQTDTANGELDIGSALGFGAWSWGLDTSG